MCVTAPGHTLSPHVINTGCREPTLWLGLASPSRVQLPWARPSTVQFPRVRPPPRPRDGNHPTQLGNPRSTGVRKGHTSLSEEATLPCTSAGRGRGAWGTVVRAQAISSTVVVALPPPCPHFKGREHCLPARCPGRRREPRWCSYKLAGLLRSKLPLQGGEGRSEKCVRSVTTGSRTQRAQQGKGTPRHPR